VTTHVGFIDQGRLLFQESMSDLSDRFRQVRITLESPGAVPLQAPKGWLQPAVAGNVLSFVDSRFAEQSLADNIAALFKGVRNIDVQPIALREIFTTLARESRGGGAS